MALDTDIKNPDSHLQVGFYSREVKNEFRSEAESKLAGKPVTINDTVDYIKIQIPGNKNLEIDTPAREEHKRRFHMHWAAYQNRGDAYGNVAGIPIEQWPRVGSNADMAQELRHIRFNTVQAIAGASDAQLQSIGMIAGQNAFTFRDDARRFLSTLEADTKLDEADKKEKEANAKLEAANAEIMRQKEEQLRIQEQHAKDMEEMRAQMKQLMAMTAQVKKPGRPPKEASA